MPPSRISRPRYQHVRKPNTRIRRDHREWINSLPCLRCGRPGPSECAHVRTYTDGGTSLRPSDRYCLPLCAGCHRIDQDSQHELGEASFYAALGIDPLDYCLRLWTVTGDTPQGLRTIERAWQAIALHKHPEAPQSCG
jgi:hypothetical protein